MSSLSSADLKLRGIAQSTGPSVLSRFSSRLGKGIVLAFLIIMALIEVMPLMWLFSTSLRLPSESYDLPPDFLPTSLSPVLPQHPQDCGGGDRWAVAHLLYGSFRLRSVALSWQQQSVLPVHGFNDGSWNGSCSPLLHHRQNSWTQ